MLIGIVGKARTGKDTFAEMLAEEIFDQFGKRVVLMAYAQELKLRVQKDFDLSYEQLWGNAKEEPDTRYEKRLGTTCTGTDHYPPGSIYPPVYWTPREIMQAYGEFYRSIDQQFWVNNLFRAIKDKEYEGVIITDVRHPNEADPIKDVEDGYIIKVISNRDDKPGIHGANHISETAMDNYERVDFVVENDEGLEELKQKSKEALQFIVEAYKKAHSEVNHNGS